MEPSLQATPPDYQMGTSHFWERTPLHFVWSLFVGFWLVDYKKGLMKIPGYTTRHSFLEVSLSCGVGLVFFVHSLVGVSPIFHASRSSLRYPWLMISFERVLTSLTLPTDNANVDARSTGVRSSLRCASQSSCLMMGDWVSLFPTQRMFGQVVRARPSET